ncbi:MAG: hypothetical protein ACI36X_02445 [Bacteroidaceae bacterium]
MKNKANKQQKRAQQEAQQAKKVMIYLVGALIALAVIGIAAGIAMG